MYIVSKQQTLQLNSGQRGQEKFLSLEKFLFKFDLKNIQVHEYSMHENSMRQTVTMCFTGKV